MAWDDARQFCEKKGAHLVDIDSLAEQKIVTDIVDVAGIRASFWIAVNDLESENDFRASDGSKQEFFNWDDKEPNDEYSEDCVEVYEKSSSKKLSKWNDKYCTDEKAFVCEKGKIIITLLLYWINFFRVFRSKKLKFHSHRQWQGF